MSRIRLAVLDHNNLAYHLEERNREAAQELQSFAEAFEVSAELDNPADCFHDGGRNSWLSYALGVVTGLGLMAIAWGLA